MTADGFTEAARSRAERVRRDAKYLTPAGRGPLVSSATTMIELREALAVAEARILAVRALHQRAWHGDLDYCRRCVDVEGAFWPCRTIEALDSAPAARRDEETR